MQFLPLFDISKSKPPQAQVGSSVDASRDRVGRDCLPRLRRSTVVSRGPVAPRYDTPGHATTRFAAWVWPRHGSKCLFSLSVLFRRLDFGLRRPDGSPDGF